MLYISVGANNRKDSLRFGDFLNIENYSSDNDMSVKMNYSPQFEKCDIEIKDETLLHNCIFLSYMLTKEGSMNIDDSLGDTGVVHQMSHYMSDKSQVETKESVVYMYNLMVDKFMEI